MSEKFVLKKGEKLTLLGTLAVNGVVTSNLDVAISSQIRSKNRTEHYSFYYSSQEIDVPTRGKFKLELDTTSIPAGSYKGDVKYILNDGSVHFDETFEVEIGEPETRA